jgi:hypothetical protein
LLAWKAAVKGRLRASLNILTRGEKMKTKPSIERRIRWSWLKCQPVKIFFIVLSDRKESPMARELGRDKVRRSLATNGTRGSGSRVNISSSK